MAPSPRRRTLLGIAVVSGASALVFLLATETTSPSRPASSYTASGESDRTVLRGRLLSPDGAPSRGTVELHYVIGGRGYVVAKPAGPDGRFRFAGPAVATAFAFAAPALARRAR